MLFTSSPRSWKPLRQQKIRVKSGTFLVLEMPPFCPFSARPIFERVASSSLLSWSLELSMMQGSKAAWIANAKRIAIEAEALERKTGTGSKSEEMKHEAAEFTKQRNEAKLATSKRVHGIRLVLSDIQNKIQTGTWQNNSALRNHLETFESKLTTFKLLMRSEYDTLEETSHVLESDIERLTSEFDSWDHPDSCYEQGEKGPQVDAEAQKRITERNRVDLERRAYIGAIDRKVSLFPTHLILLLVFYTVLYPLSLN